MNEKLKNVKAVIFDLDGTLIDTEKIYSIVWPKAIAALGYEMTHEQYLSIRSLGRPFAPQRYKGWYGEEFDYDKARNVRKGLFEAYEKEHGIQGKPGAVELLTHLHSKGIITAIATATDPERANRYLEKVGLNGYFDRIISATMVDEGKPSPKVYQYAVAKLGLAPDECVAVEDAPNGIESAYKAGCRVIMVPDLSEPDDTINHMLTACVRRLDEICELI